MTDRPPFRILLARAVRRRCPRSGQDRLFESWGEVKHHCGACGFKHERQPGYWVGALIVNTAVTLFLIGAVLVGGMVLTWPTVPWTGVLIATVGVAGVAPVAFYPWSKSLWMAVEMAFHPVEEAEREAAAGRVSPGSRQH